VADAVQEREAAEGDVREGREVGPDCPALGEEVRLEAGRRLLEAPEGEAWPEAVTDAGW
jgi:hypothetical protein